MNMSRYLRRGLPAALSTLAALGLAGAMTAIAQDSPARDTRTQLLVSSCANCHGTSGQGAAPIVPLAGRPYETLRAQLLDFKHGQAPAATVMTRILSGYSEEELEALARYFASLPVGVER